MRTHQVASRDVLGFPLYMRMFAEFQHTGWSSAVTSLLDDKAVR